MNKIFRPISFFYTLFLKLPFLSRIDTLLKKEAVWKNLF